MFSMKKRLMKTAVVLAVVILACSCGYTATINVHWTAALQNKKIVQDRANALKVAKELNDCKRIEIEILNLPDRYRVIIANKNDIKVPSTGAQGERHVLNGGGGGWR